MDVLLQRRKVEASTYFENLMTKLEELETVFRQTVKEEEKFLNNDSYFRDGTRKIDFVFVYKRYNKQNIKDTLHEYIKNLENEGVEFEAGKSEQHPELSFIKVHVSRVTLLMWSVLLNYEATFMRIPDPPIHQTRIINLPFMYNELLRGELLSEVVQRASESSLGSRPKDLTGAERIMITGEILKNVKYGDKQFEYGLTSLLENKYLEDAFPLHEHPSKWTQNGSLNDRQLLNKYWASYTMVFKYQPLDLIYKYYGPEVAFYFAFIGFYNRMLVPVAILGLFAFIYGLITYDSDKNPFSRVVCSSNETFCPACQFHRYCTYRPVSVDCNNSKMHYVLDNTCTMLYSIFMCFWATTVAELWKRQENILKYKWNLLTVEQDTRPRADYTKHSTYKRLNKYTGNFDYYIPQKIYKLKVMLSWICCGFLATIAIAIVIGVIVLRMVIVYIIHDEELSPLAADIAKMSSHLGSTFFFIITMILFDFFYKHIAKKLTDFERPRTQTQYDKSFIFKLHVLSFLNAYAYLYYMAFFRGTFKTYPSDEEQYKNIGILNNDVDEAMGPMLPLSLQLILIFTWKSVIKMVYQVIMPWFIMTYKNRKVQKQQGHGYVYSSLERDYNRNKIGYYDIAVNEFKTVIQQYGYVILFPAAFPLGPLIAFLANIFEIRIDAYKLTKWSRRPVPMRVPGIGAWNSILSTMSYIGIVTNCFYIAFTTNFIYYVKYYIYNEEVDILKATFSEFNVKDYDVNSNFYGFVDVDTCLYEAIRFPPNHPRKYQHNKEYWQTLCSKLICVIALEFMVLGFNKLLSFAIPDMPSHIKERIRMRRQRENAAREKRLNDKLTRENPTRISIVREQIAARLLQMQPNM